MVKFQYRALSSPERETKEDSEVFIGRTSNPKGLRESLTESGFLDERGVSPSSERERIPDAVYAKVSMERLTTQWCCCCKCCISWLMESCNCCISWPKDAWTLLVTTVLFGLITVAQLLGAIISRSIALFGDSVSMLVDVITYLSNLYAELSAASAYDKKRNQLIASGFSLAVLMILSFAVIYSSVDRLVKDIEGNKEVVDPDIVLVFAIIGIVFDIASCSAFWKLSRGTVTGKKEPQDSCLPAEVSSADSGSQINMISALLHVLSDSIRSLTTLLEAILIKYFGTNGEITDACAGIIMFSLILVGGIGAVRKWWETYQNFRNPRIPLENPEHSPRVLRMSSEERDDLEVEMGSITQRDSSPHLANSSRRQDDHDKSSIHKIHLSEIPQECSEESPNPPE